tara:strand:+ start:187 stop:1356 length:1170 start_codon:yes stop_codon:yes gene_type:complete
MRDLIKKILREEVGVPRGIVNSAQRLYNDIISRLKRKTITGNSTFILTFKNVNGKYSFSDFQDFESIKVEFEFKEYSETDMHKGILILGMGHNGQSRLDDGFELINLDTDNINLSIDLAIPETINEIDNKIIIKTLEDNKQMIVSSLSHELKHAYDGFKKPSEGLKQRSQYNVYSGTRFGIEEIDEFVYFLYFITVIENLVRPSEIYSLMQQGEISQKDFLNFISSNRTYSTLKKINEFSVDKLIESLKQKPEEVDNLLSNVEDYEMPDSIDEKINDLLKVIYLELQKKTLQRAHSMLTNNFFEALFGLSDEKMKFLNSFESEILKFKNNPLKYFEFQEKKFKFVSEKMMKRLSKLYSLAKPNPIKLVNKDPMTFEMRMLESKPRNIKS